MAANVCYSLGFQSISSSHKEFIEPEKLVEVSSDLELLTEEDESDDDLLNRELSVAAYLGYEADVPDDDPVESSRKAEDEPIMVASKGQLHCKLDIPVLKAQENVRNECRKQLQQVLNDIKKLIKLKQTFFDAGQKSLQLY